MAEERDKREQLLKRKFMKEIEQVTEEFETQIESLQHDLDNAKYANMVLENHMHELRLEQEKSNKLISSSFHSLGMGFLKKMNEPSMSSEFKDSWPQPDWLDS